MKPIDKMSLTEIAAEIHDRVNKFRPGVKVERAGTKVRVAISHRRADEYLFNKEQATRYLERLRAGYELVPGEKKPVTVYAVEYGRMKELPGGMDCVSIWSTEYAYRTVYLTPLEAALASLRSKTTALKEAQDAHAAAVALVEQQRANQKEQ